MFRTSLEFCSDLEIFLLYGGQRWHIGIMKGSRDSQGDGDGRHWGRENESK